MSRPCSCPTGNAVRWPVLHHLPCAYVGPSYDFTAGERGYTCPKCDITFEESGPEGEVLGYAWRCPICGAEWLEDDLP